MLEEVPQKHSESSSEEKTFNAIAKLGAKVYKETGLDRIFQIDESKEPNRAGLKERLMAFLEERGYRLGQHPEDSMYASVVDNQDKIWFVRGPLELLPFNVLAHECVHITDNTYHIQTDEDKYSFYKRAKKSIPNSIKQEARAYAVNIFLGHIKSSSQWRFGVFGSVSFNALIAGNTRILELFDKLKKQEKDFIITDKATAQDTEDQKLVYEPKKVELGSE